MSQESRTDPPLLYPVWLDVRCVPVLLAGAGRAAHRKAVRLLESGAQVTVVAPDLHPDFSSWQAEGKLKIHQRPYSQGDLAGQRMVLACTNDRQLNRAIIEEARKRGIWGASATTGTEADLFPGATFRRGALSLSLSSTGLAPVAVRALRECLEDLLDDRWAGLFEELGHERQEHLAHGREAMEGIVQKVRAQFAESVERYQRRALKVEEEGRSTA